MIDPRTDPDEGRNPLADNIRMWRVRRGFSLSRLARDAEISKSTVSELERGNGNPSLDTLSAIARTLNIPIGFLFADGPDTSDVEVQRLTDAPILSYVEGHSITQLLAGWRARGEVELSIVTIAASQRVDSPGGDPRATTRVLCVEGQVEVTVKEHHDLLTQSDLITFPGDSPHSLRAVGGAARLLVVEQYAPSP